MTRTIRLLLAGGVAAMLCLSASELMAQNQGGGRQGRGNNQGGGRQGRGNFDPAQFQQRMMDRYKEILEIKDDAEWRAIQPLVQKVMDARMAVGARGRGMGGRGNQPGGNQADPNQRPGADRANPEAEALQKAVDSKASGAELRSALAKYLDSRKAKQADLEKAQADLRKVLTPRQEALGVLASLL
jgi:hypothetical protein